MENLRGVFRLRQSMDVTDRQLPCDAFSMAMEERAGALPVARAVSLL